MGIIRKYFSSILCICLLINVFSCTSTKKIKYFQDIPDSGRLQTFAKVEYAEPKIQVDDILTIVILTIDPKASELINAGNINSSAIGTVVGASNYTQQVTSGYLVDKAGDVDLPIIGKVKLAGLTTSEAKEAVLKAVSKEYEVKSAIVRLANFKISINGEVARPGTYIMPNEKVTILDAISLAGDLTIFGKRDNVLLIRENEQGVKVPYRINLNKSDVFTAPYYYLHQNDMIYVQPSKAKVAANDAAQSRNFAIIGSILSVLIVLFTRN